MTTRGQQTQSVLDTIDAALSDRLVGSDAMRWAPELPPPPTQTPSDWVVERDGWLCQQWRPGV